MFRKHKSDDRNLLHAFANSRGRETLSRGDPGQLTWPTLHVESASPRVVRTDQITLEIGFAWRAALRHSDITPFAPNYIKFQNKMRGRNLHFPSGAHIRAAPLGPVGSNSRIKRAWCAARSGSAALKLYYFASFERMCEVCVALIMSFNEFLRDHYKAAVGVVRSAHVAVPTRNDVFVKHSTTPRHDDRLFSRARLYCLVYTRDRIIFPRLFHR